MRLRRSRQSESSSHIQDQANQRRLTKLLGAFSFVLFVLGNVLLFHPLPTSQQTCYHASPMLWWGVMTVTGVGWFLFGQIIIVVLVIGVGGPAILVCHPIPNSESADQSDYITPTTLLPHPFRTGTSTRSTTRPPLRR